MAPPWWHQALDHFGLFLQYFASTLALGIIGYLLWRMIRDGRPYWSAARWGMVGVGIPFLALAVISLIRAPSAEISFWFETFFILTVLCLLLGQMVRGGDLGVKIGILFLATPLVVHYYGPLSLRFFAGEEALWGGFPERIQHYGQWTMVMAALVSPYCFAPRPFLRSAIRLAPLAVATFVGVIGVVILRQHYEVGMRLAHHGLGVDIGPGAPSRYIAVYVIALATITWTLASCLSADSESRRNIGVGLGLVVVGGYGFAWPLQYLVSLVGLMTIGAATTRVVEEERSTEAKSSGEFRAPPIADEVWQRYIGDLAEALAPSRDDDDDDDDEAEEAADRGASIVTIRGEEGRAVTHLVTERYGLEVALRIGRQDESISTIDIVCGAPALSETEPDWTLYARPEKLLGVGSHPEPPVTSAPVRRIDDVPFDDRFRIRDSGRITEKLFDDGMRARATALIDGWVAFWSDYGLRYRVHPGFGAPLDHPIPITELAFRGSSAVASAERLATLVDLLASMANRALSP